MRSSSDPWKHRKGEPRALALLWSMYLIAATFVTILSVEQSWPPSVDQYEFPVRVLMTLVLFGIAILWPTLRLCQSTPRKPAVAALADAIVVLVPAQILIWPMVLMLSWPISVVAAIATASLSWGMLAMAAISWGVTGEARSRRHTAISTTLAASLIAVIVGVLFGQSDPEAPFNWIFAWSPFTAPWVLTQVSSPLAEFSPSRMMWAGVTLPGAVGIGWWITSWMIEQPNSQSSS